ncbi:MerR family transcriptional regulator [Paenibacillus montanisoli]|uniref:MerR family transcriptional regulator n=1 Tax=Paenibacillus montanisoli TaxID=2081970 RepID=UPI001403412F|nr:MerR family transcriptional regulator [Paenibacillus montanisoli]
MLGALYTIKEVSELTGLSTQLIRKWEQRYAAVNPLRMPNGYRGYTAQDIETIRWLKRRVDEGKPIGMAAMELKSLLYSNIQPPLADSVDGEGERQGPIGMLLHYLEQADLCGAEKVYQQLRALRSMELLLAEVIKPALLELGERFERGELNESQKNAGSQFIRDRWMASRI